MTEALQKYERQVEILKAADREKEFEVNEAINISGKSLYCFLLFRLLRLPHLLRLHGHCLLRLPRCLACLVCFACFNRFDCFTCLFYCYVACFACFACFTCFPRFACLACFACFNFEANGANGSIFCYIHPEDL